MSVIKSLYYFTAIQLGAAALITFSPMLLHATNEGKVQLSMASPDPVNAGEQIVFRTAVHNQGNVTWEHAKYYVQVEIFNENMKYVGRIRNPASDTDIRPGETATIEVQFSVPTNYNGPHFYKVYLIMDSQYIVESDYYRFDVIAISPGTKESFLKDFSGSMSISFRNTDKNNWNNLTASLNLNSISYKSENPMQFFVNTYHTLKSTDTTKMRDEVFSFFYSKTGAKYSFEMGDIFPNFSKLGLSNMSMRGMYYERRMEKVSTEFVASRIEAPTDNSIAYSPVYDRWLTGAKTKYFVSPRLTLGANYILSFDNAGSIGTPQTGITPAQNIVWGGMMGYKLSEPLELETEFMVSDNNFDTSFVSTSAVPVTDYGWRTGLNYKRFKLNSKMYIQESRPNFYSFGAPGVKNDRRMFDFQNKYAMNEKIDLNLGYNQWSDNLVRDPLRITSTQKTYSSSVGYMPVKDASRVIGGYSFSENTGDMREKEDNYTHAISLNYFKRIDKTNVFMDFQKIAYFDNTHLSDNTLTFSNGVYINTPLSSRLNLNTGIVFINSHNQVKQYLTAGQNYSASAVYNIMKDFLSTQLWVFYKTEKNDTGYLTEKIDNSGMNTNLEFSVKLRQYMTWVLGGIYIMNDSYSRDTFQFIKTEERGITTRLIMDF